jgi:hypothetical protein
VTGLAAALILLVGWLEHRREVRARRRQNAGGAETSVGVSVAEVEK